MLFNVCLNVFPSATVTVLKAILFAAAVPSLISLVCVLYSANTIVYVPLQSVESSVPSEVEYPPLWRAFLRTGVSWLLYDFNVPLLSRLHRSLMGTPSFRDKSSGRSFPFPIPLSAQRSLSSSPDSSGFPDRWRFTGFCGGGMCVKCKDWYGRKWTGK